MKKYIIPFVIILILPFALPIFLYLYPVNMNTPLQESPLSKSSAVSSFSADTNEKRGAPAYDWINGADNLPHCRVFFWVPKSAKRYYPYADPNVNTDVSHHGPVEKWSVQETTVTTNTEKLVFIYVPKTFIFFYGNGFDKVIHLKYE